MLTSDILEKSVRNRTISKLVSTVFTSGNEHLKSSAKLNIFIISSEVNNYIIGITNFKMLNFLPKENVIFLAKQIIS